MSKLVKLIASFIIFLIIFNVNSISYSKAYSNNDEYKLAVQKDIFFVSNEADKKFNFNLSNILMVEKKVNKIVFSSTFTSFLSYLVLAFNAILSNTLHNMFYFDFFVYSSILIFNSFFIYFISFEQNNNYFIAFFGVSFGIIFYFIFNLVQVFLESLFIPNPNNSLTTANQESLAIFFMPLCISFIGTTFYHLITKEKSEEMTEEKLSKVLEEQSKSMKDFSNKVRINSNSVSFSLVKF